MKAAGVLNLEVDDLKGNLNANTPHNKARLSRLIECRNQLAHRSLTSDKKWLDKPRMKSIFADALFVVTCAGEYLKIKNGGDNYAKENMERLKEQWETHTESRHRRKNAMRLFVGNVPDGATEEDLKVILNGLMEAKKYNQAGLFAKKSSSAFQASLRLNIYKEISKTMCWRKNLSKTIRERSNYA